MYFTDSFAPVLYKIPIGPDGGLGSGATLPLSGPAATIDPTGFNLNGIDATPDGSTLIANHTALGALFTIDPATGASEQIDVDGLVPGTPDGLLLAGRDVWVVENFANTLVRVTLSPGGRPVRDQPHRETPRHAAVHPHPLLLTAAGVAPRVLITIDGARHRTPPSPQTSEPGTVDRSHHTARLVGEAG